VIEFEVSSATLTPTGIAIVDEMEAAIKQLGTPRIQIIGHTDSAGSDAYNERLSLLRAEEVKRYLVGDCGIAETRMEAVGVGSRFPYDAQNPRADVNRRVEFQALS